MFAEIFSAPFYHAHQLTIYIALYALQKPRPCCDYEGSSFSLNTVSLIENWAAKLRAFEHHQLGYHCGPGAYCALGKHFGLGTPARDSTVIGLCVFLSSFWQVTVPVNSQFASTAYRSDEDHYTQPHYHSLLILPHTVTHLPYPVPALVLAQPTFVLPLLVPYCRLNLYPF